MATPGQLVKTIAEALGLPAEIVTNYDRVLSENGMRSKSGRGRGAAKVTASDAANLLIAILGSPVAGASVKEAANTCRAYGSLRAIKSASGRYGSGKTSFTKLGLPRLGDLPNKHTLHDGLSELIDSAAKGEHFQHPEEHFRQRTIVQDSLCHIRLTGPDPWAEIEADASFGVALGKDQRFATCVYTHQPKKRVPPVGLADLYQSRSITYRTIRMLGALLSESKRADRDV
jgi:hypothetical protein